MSNAYPQGRGNGPSGPRASARARSAALVVDGLVLAVPTVVLVLALPLPVAVGAASVVAIAYSAWFEAQPAGQTFGKRAMKIRVVDFTNGDALSMPKALLRSIIRYISAVACGLGLLWALVSREKQAWHDLASQTVVVPTSDYPVP